MSILVEHGLGPDELVRTIALLARAERIDGVLIERLIKSEAVGEPEPEMYLNAIVDGIKGLWPSLVDSLLESLGKWFSQTIGENLLEKANVVPSAQLTQAQIDELIELIRAHFRSAIRPNVALGDFATSSELERKWHKMGIVAPYIRLVHALNNAFVAGRLYAVLTENSSYGDMLAAAERMVASRPVQLQQQIALRDASLYFLRPVDELATEVEEQAQRVNNGVVREVVNRYMEGSLKPTNENRDGLAPQEIAMTESAGSVAGWRQLAGELRNRMLGVEMGRDWGRVAATETRFVFNAGRLAEFRERKVAFVSWRVRDDACPYCKKLLLNDDGTPRKFSSDFMEQMLAQTGGNNVGRKASLIGKPGGWLVTALIHPWCRCVPYPSEHLELLDAA